MKSIKSHTIEDALQDFGRTYLCGNLKKANGISHIHTTGYEMGITDYPVFTFEKAHIHTFNQEYNYVLSGSVKVFLLNEQQEHVFHEGDLFVIETGEPHVAKQFPGTRTLFAKVPGGDDKELVEMNSALIHWGSSWENKYQE